MRWRAGRDRVSIRGLTPPARRELWDADMTRLATEYVERHRATEWFQVAAVKPPAVRAGWETFAPTAAARAVAVTPAGEVWAATPGGVLAWDRRETTYRRYAAEHGLAGNAVGCLCVDVAGRIWAGHLGGGLSVFAEGWKPTARFDEPVRTVAVAPAAEGVWVATDEAVYLVPSPDAEPILVRSGDGNASALADALLADGVGVLVGNEWGLSRLAADRDPEPVAAGECTALARDARGVVWAAVDGGVYRLGPDGLGSPVAPDGPPVRVRGLAAGGGSVWAATAAGLGRIAEGRWRWAGGPVPLAVAARPLDAACWVGTADRLALAWFVGDEPHWAENQLPPHPEDALGARCRCAAVGPDGTVLVGTSRGLAVFRADGSWAFDADAGDVRAVAGGWALSWPHGVGAVAGDALAFTLPPPDGVPLAVGCPPGGAAHALTTRGFWRLDGGRWAAAGAGLDADAPALGFAPDGSAWVGTARGAYRLVGGAWALAGEQPGPVQAAVDGFAVANGALWAAAGNGLWERTVGGWRRHLDGPVRSAGAAVGGRVWVGGRDGLMLYDPAAGAVARRFTPRDSGLADRRIAAVVEAAGRVYAATEAGVSRMAVSG